MLKREEYKGLTLRSLLLGLALITLNCYWIIAAENRVIWEITDFSTFPTTLTTLLIVTILNVLFAKLLNLKRPPLDVGELVVVYVMVSIASGLAGHDMVRQLIPMMGNAFWYARPENEWADLFHRYLPTWLTVSDKEVLRGYYEGGGWSTFWDEKVIRAWLVPALAWSAFIILFLFMALCFNTIIRKQWIDHEKLSYPIIRLPQEMIANSSGFLSSRLMWLGFGIAFALELIAGIHYLYPIVPSPRLKYDIGRYFTERPWNAIGWLPIHVYPFAVGLGYLMPLDLSLSLWVFYLFWKFQLVFSAAVGWGRVGAGYQGEQRAGAWIGIALLALWTSRRFIWRVVSGVFKGSERDGLYRTAVIGFIISFALLVFFMNRAGMSWWFAASYLAIFFLFSIAITRMRAELGPPTHELHGMHPDRTMIMFIGTRRIGPQNLSVSTVFDWIAYGYRCHPMPHQLEGYKLASATGTDERRLAVAMVIAAAAGTFASILLHLWLYYKYRYVIWGVGEFYRLQSWLTYPIKFDELGVKQFAFGFLFSAFLTFMRRRFVWWPFYAVGYAVGGGWAISWMWFSIFLSWLSKRLLIGFGGLKMYRRAMPFFLGLILGQFFMGSMWALLGVILNKHMYTLFP